MKKILVCIIAATFVLSAACGIVLAGGDKCNNFTFDATKSRAYGGDKLNYHWDFGDGPTSDQPVVTHPFAHACCLKAKSSTRVTGTTVDIVEQLTGSACRCMCESTIETTVGLKPGNYEVVLTLVSTSGDRQEALRTRVVVAKP